jgi:hypothetical protein
MNEVWFLCKEKDKRDEDNSNGRHTFIDKDAG